MHARRFWRTFFFGERGARVSMPMSALRFDALLSSLPLTLAPMRREQALSRFLHVGFLLMCRSSLRCCTSPVQSSTRGWVAAHVSCMFVSHLPVPCCAEKAVFLNEKSWWTAANGPRKLGAVPPGARASEASTDTLVFGP